MSDTSKIITPDRKNAKIVDIRNEPLRKDDDGAIKKEQSAYVPSDKTVRVAAALRDLASKLEDGSFPAEFLVVLPMMPNNDVPLIYMGDPIATIALEGVLHRVVTRLAIQQG